MKKIFLSFIFMLAVSSIFGQKIKADDGLITVDKKPYAKYEGEASLFKGINLTFKSLSDDVLFSVTMEETNFFIPDWVDLAWYELTFKKPAVKVKYVNEAFHRSEKKIAELFLFKIDPPLFVDDAIDVSAVNEFVKKYDNTAQVTKDSADYFEYETNLIKALKGKKVERDLKEKVWLKQISSENFGGLLEVKYHIVQDSLVIGGLEKTDDARLSQRVTVYKIHKNLNSPLKRGDKTTTKGLALYCEASSFPKIYTIEDKSVTELKAVIDEKSELFLAEFLVRRGLL